MQSVRADLAVLSQPLGPRDGYSGFWFAYLSSQTSVSGKRDRGLENRKVNPYPQPNMDCRSGESVDALLNTTPANLCDLNDVG